MTPRVSIGMPVYNFAAQASMKIPQCRLLTLPSRWIRFECCALYPSPKRENASAPFLSHLRALRVHR